MSSVNEALLEMHYFRELVDSFEVAYRADAQLQRVFKPSPQKEAWLGYDMALVLTELEEKEFEAYIEAQIHGRRDDTFFVGLFLQYKVVEPIKGKYEKDGKSNVPEGFSVPFYRSLLKTAPTKNTIYSQHETLIRLSQVKGAEVCYICPMLFDGKDVLLKPNLSDLQVVRVDTKAVNNYNVWVVEGTHEDKHYIVFQDTQGNNQKWCSDHPLDGTCLGYFDWLTTQRFIRQSPTEIIEFISEIKSVSINKLDEGKGKSQLFPSSFILFEYKITKSAKKETRKIRS